MTNDNLNEMLKERLARDEILVLPGVANARGGRVVEEVGFEALYVSGAGIANMFLGAFDVGLVTLTEVADHVAAIRDAVELQMVVDIDTGYGNALNVARTVRVLERSGANAVQMEDQVTPKRCGHFGGKEVISREEMIQKVRAALEARRDSAFTIIARTDARAALGFEEALKRAADYAEAGADVTLIEAPQSAAEMAAIPKELPGPQVVNVVEGGLTPALGVRELDEIGFAIALYANIGLQGAIRGMQNTLSHLYERGSITDLPDDMLVRWRERQRVGRKPRFDELEKRYAAEKQAR
jgi:2-methylisocitrate lyase-like PEP mutase family enzyme